MWWSGCNIELLMDVGDGSRPFKVNSELAETQKGKSTIFLVHMLKSESTICLYPSVIPCMAALSRTLKLFY